MLLVAVYECLHLSPHITLFLTLFVTWRSLMLSSDFLWCDVSALWCGLTFGTIFRIRKGVVEFLHECCPYTILFNGWRKKCHLFMQPTPFLCAYDPMTGLWMHLPKVYISRPSYHDVCRTKDFVSSEENWSHFLNCGYLNAVEVFCKSLILFSPKAYGWVDFKCKLVCVLTNVLCSNCISSSTIHIIIA